MTARPDARDLDELDRLARAEIAALDAYVADDGTHHRALFGVHDQAQRRLQDKLTPLDVLALVAEVRALRAVAEAWSGAAHTLRRGEPRARLNTALERLAALDGSATRG